MVNEKRGSFWEEQAFVAGVAVVITAIATVTGFAGGTDIILLYVFGALYGMLSYRCWLILIETYPYDENCEPKGFDGKQACIAVIVPVGVAFLLILSAGLLGIAILWSLVQWATGRYDFAE